MDILDDMGVSKLSAIFFFKVNYSFKYQTPLRLLVPFALKALYLLNSKTKFN